MLSESSPSQMAVEKKFANLLIGDRIRTVAKITNLKSDQKNDVPKWHLAYLFDGSKTIRIFIDDVSNLKIGDKIELEFSVKEGKPWNGNQQLAFDLHYMSKLNEPKKTMAPIPKLKAASPTQLKQEISNVVGFLRKEELKILTVDQPVQFYTKVRTLKPKDGIREHNCKIILVDLEMKSVGLWLPKTEISVFEAIEDDEYFVVNAIIKKTHDNPFLVFQSLTRGKKARMSTIAQRFYAERIKYYSHELDKCLKLVKNPTKEHELLATMLESFNHVVYRR